MPNQLPDRPHHHQHLSKEHQLHLWQGRLTALADLEIDPQAQRRLRSEAENRIKELRVEMQREQQLELVLPARP